MMSVVVLVSTRSFSYLMLLVPASSKCSATRNTGGCSSDTSVVPSGRMSNVHFTATSHTSAPLRSRTQPRSAANGVRLSTCHMGSLARRASIDVDGSTLDLVVARRSAEHVSALDQHLPRPRQRDARVATPQHDFALCGDDKTVLVGLHRHERPFAVGYCRLLTHLFQHHTHDNRAARVAVLVQYDHRRA